MYMEVDQLSTSTKFNIKFIESQPSDIDTKINV
jgi:hypothetical protein